MPAMPLLRFTTSVGASAADWQAFARRVAELYADIMATEQSHIAIERTQAAHEDLWLGRSVSGEFVFLDADVRAGRGHDQRRAFAVEVMDELAVRWGVPKPNMKIVFTEHAGELMMGYDRVGDDWAPGQTGDDGTGQ
jgi:hypothetical protein